VCSRPLNRVFRLPSQASLRLVLLGDSVHPKPHCRPLAGRPVGEGLAVAPTEPQMALPRTRRRAGFTLSELLFCLVLLLGGLVGSSVGGLHFRWVGVLVGFPVGFLTTAAALFLLVSIPESLWLAGPMYPPCHNGCCKGRVWPADIGDYDSVSVAGDPVLRCRCGRDYDKEGRRFMERLPGGTLKPYMVHRPFRGWLPETGRSQ